MFKKSDIGKLVKIISFSDAQDIWINGNCRFKPSINHKFDVYARITDIARTGSIKIEGNYRWYCPEWAYMPSKKTLIPENLFEL